MDISYTADLIVSCVSISSPLMHEVERTGCVAADSIVSNQTK
jgi:hypothetical protein